MRHTIQIGGAELGDSAGIGKVQLSSWRTMFADSGVSASEYLDQFSDQERAEDWQEYLAELPANRSIYVAIAGETGETEVVGFVEGVLNVTGDTAYASELNVVHVLPAYRNQGIGTRLILQVAQRLKQEDAPSINLWTLTGNPARRLYERLGGEKVGEQVVTTEKNGVEIAISEMEYGWREMDRLIEACGFRF